MSYRLIGISILVTALMLVGGCGGGGEQQGIAATSQTVAPASVVGRGAPGGSACDRGRSDVRRAPDSHASAG